MQSDEIVTRLPDAERLIVADFEQRGITVRFAKLGDRDFSCRAWYTDRRDPPIVTYGETPEQAIRQTSESVRGTWPDLFRLNE